MSTQSKPSSSGLYRIRHLDSGRYMEFVPEKETWVKLATQEPSSANQKWNITLQGGNEYTISTALDGRYLFFYRTPSTYWGYGYPVGSTNARNWTIEEKSDGRVKYSTITLSGVNNPLDAVPAAEGVVHFYRNDVRSQTQRWVFEPIQVDPQPPPYQSDPNPPTPQNNTYPQPSFESTFYTFTIDQALKTSKVKPFDIIVIGTGIGGGIIAGDLFDTNSMLGRNAKHVLVIERGGLLFHSHCLNTSRPTGLGEDRGQQNDTFFEKFKQDYHVSPETNQNDLKAGAMYNLGGRSAAWGLFLPRMHDATLDTYFDRSVHDDLNWEFYRKAEELMTLSLPTTKTVHQDLMERLNMTIEDDVKSVKSVQWQWGRIASEFRDDGNFDFARGAYSTIDKLLEIAMSKPKDQVGKMMEHHNFKQLLNTEVRRLQIDNSNNITGVFVCRNGDPTQTESLINLKAGGKIVLCAGSVASAAILLRSGVPLERYGGLHITDHDIFYKARAFQYKDPPRRQLVGPMKLQSFVRIQPDGADERQSEVALANMSLDASSFLPRGLAQLDDFPKCIVSFIRLAKLNPKNTIKLVENEPRVTLNRNSSKSLDNSSATIQTLEKLTEKAIKTISEVLEVDFLPDPTETSQYFKALEVGGVAHELGTIPMKGPRNENAYCLESDLKMRDYEGLYVCDLSVFPVSPEVNPTLTLAALALRLSRRTLLQRDKLLNEDGVAVVQDADTVYVVNHKGRDVKVWLSNRAGVTKTDDDDDDGEGIVLDPGKYYSWRRRNGITESVSVFELAYLEKNDFLTVPWLMSAQPGSITPVL